jgi:hypothetical protein
MRIHGATSKKAVVCRLENLKHHRFRGLFLTPITICHILTFKTAVIKFKKISFYTDAFHIPVIRNVKNPSTLALT